MFDQRQTNVVVGGFEEPLPKSNVLCGAGACEVVFFEELKVLAPHAVRAWQVRRVLPWIAGALLLAILVVAATTTPRRGEVRA